MASQEVEVLFWGLCAAVWGAGRLCKKQPLPPACEGGYRSPAFPVLAGGHGKGDGFVLSTEQSLGLLTCCHSSMPSALPCFPEQNKQCGLFAFLFKWPLFTFFHTLPPWHAGQQGEGAFSQALHHMGLVSCVLFFSLLLPLPREGHCIAAETGRGSNAACQ